jgi:DNA polymerase-3 subunit chi
MIMTRVDFYLLTTNTSLPFACRLIDKAYQQSESAYVYTSSIQESQQLDELLWTFSDISFIPHSMITTENSSVIPFLIGNTTPPAICQNLLINLTNELPDFFKQFKRVIEIVPATEEKKSLARKRFAEYRQQNCELNTHQINAH